MSKQIHFIMKTKPECITTTFDENRKLSVIPILLSMFTHGSSTACKSENKQSFT